MDRAVTARGRGSRQPSRTATIPGEQAFQQGSESRFHVRSLGRLNDWATMGVESLETLLARLDAVDAQSAVALSPSWDELWTVAKVWITTPLVGAPPELDWRGLEVSVRDAQTFVEEEDLGVSAHLLSGACVGMKVFRVVRERGGEQREQGVQQLFAMSERWHPMLEHPTWDAGHTIGFHLWAETEFARSREFIASVERSAAFSAASVSPSLLTYGFGFEAAAPSTA